MYNPILSAVFVVIHRYVRHTMFSDVLKNSIAIIEILSPIPDFVVWKVIDFWFNWMNKYWSLIGARQLSLFSIGAWQMGMVVPLFLQAATVSVSARRESSWLRTAVMLLSTSFSTKSGMGSRIFAIICSIEFCDHWTSLNIVCLGVHIHELPRILQRELGCNCIRCHIWLNYSKSLADNSSSVENKMTTALSSLVVTVILWWTVKADSGSLSERSRAVRGT